MNRDDAERLLRLRRQLTNESLSNETVDAWARVLHDVRRYDAERALERLVRQGATKVTAGDIAGLTIRRTVASTEEADDATAERISLDEYLRRAEARAARGALPADEARGVEVMRRHKGLEPLLHTVEEEF